LFDTLKWIVAEASANFGRPRVWIGVEKRPRQLAFHRAGQANAERLRRIFNGRMKNELLNESLLFDLGHARKKTGDLGGRLNHHRPHPGSATSPLRPMPRA